MKRTTRRPQLRPVFPNEGLRTIYQRRLEAAIDQMQRDVTREVLATYKDRPPVMALVGDESPAMRLRDALRRMTRRWERTFETFAPKLAAYFVTAAAQRVDGQLKAMLRDAGMTVRFQATKLQNDVLQAAIGENVGLIRSIPQQYLGRVEGAVMRSVQAGRDLGTLATELQEAHGVTKRRAAFIALDQNNKASANLARTRQLELGLTKARWRHSGAGKEPRPEHVAFSGKLYDIREGAFLENKYVWPGTEPNCRCVSIPVIPGFDD